MGRDVGGMCDGNINKNEKVVFDKMCIWGIR